MASITLKGKPINTNADLPNVGSSAPDFKLVTKDLKDVSLDSYAGKRIVLSILPSLDTAVCATSTRKFNEAATQLDNTIILTISADLPFAMGRFCETENIQNVVALSMMRSRNFAKDYGVLIQDGPLAGITARAILVIDENKQVIYTELVTDITNEPNYDAALAALNAI